MWDCTLNVGGQVAKEQRLWAGKAGVGVGTQLWGQQVTTVGLSSSTDNNKRQLKKPTRPTAAATMQLLLSSQKDYGIKTGTKEKAG